MAKSSLFERMAELYGNRNRAREAFAKLDKASAIGKEDPIRYNKMIQLGNDINDIERDILKNKVDAYENIAGPEVYRGQPLPDRYNWNMEKASGLYDKKRDMQIEAFRDWKQNNPYDYKVYKREGGSHYNIPSYRREFKNAEARMLADPNTPDASAFESIADDMAKERAKYLDMEYRGASRHFSPGKINFVDKKGVEHDPAKYFYNESFINAPWKRGNPLTDEERADLMNGL